MKAVRVEKYGGAEVLEVKENIPSLKPKKGQILVEVHAAGINPFDIHLLSGMSQKMIPLTFPLTPGGDFAGIIKEIGDGVTEYKVGDEVFGTAIVLSGGSGSWSEEAIVVVNKFSRKPKSVGFLDAAALPVAGLTAVEAIRDHANIQKGQKILIHGGAGGVGHFAIQYAKVLGSFVATTVSKDDFEFVKSLGADQVIDYKNEDFSTSLKDFDAVLDVVGGQINTKSYQVLKPGGVLVTTVGQSSEELEKKYSVKTIKQSTVTDSEHYLRIAKLVDDGKIKPHIDKVFPLSEIKAAFDHLKSGHPRGKVVLKVK